MAVSAFDLFKIGIGPSSSHTVGPMRAARLFVTSLQAGGLLDRVARVRCDLHGSLGATGRGHGSDKAVLLGLCGLEPETVPIEAVEPTIADIRLQGAIGLLGFRALIHDPRTRHLPGFIPGSSHLTSRNWYLIFSQQRFGLILMDIHRFDPPSPEIPL